MELTLASRHPAGTFGSGRPLSGPLAKGPVATAVLGKGPQPPMGDYCKGAGAPVMTIVRMNSMLRRQPVIPTSFPTSERSKNIA